MNPRSPYLFDVALSAECRRETCSRPACRVVVMVNDGDTPGTNEITVAFFCDECAAAAHASMLPARGVA